MNRSIAVLPNGFTVYPISGAERGYSTEGDAINLGRLTGDQANLQTMFDEFLDVLDLYNQAMNSLVSLLSYPTTLPGELVAQLPGNGSKFESASEFGVPQSQNAATELDWFGSFFDDRDLATRYTWKFLRDADPRQIEAMHSEAIASDSKTILDEVMASLFGLRTGVNEAGRNVLPLYNGDSMLPPRYLWNTFTQPHSHYLTSGSADLDGSDLRDLRDTIKHHGFPQSGGRLVLLANPELVEVIATFRMGDVAGNPYDFIPSPNQPAHYNSEGEIIGQLAPATWGGEPVVGQWGDVLIIEHEYMPPTHLAMVASSGPGSLYNPIAFRQHANPAYQGLRLIPGNQLRFPLIESFYSRGFGVGVRHRGAAAVMQITASSTYTPPSQFS